MSLIKNKKKVNFTKKKNKNIFVKIMSNFDERFNFQILVFKDSFNQINLDSVTILPAVVCGLTELVGTHLKAMRSEGK